MRATAPLFRLDPGWLFVLAGLALCAVGVLVPTQYDGARLDGQLDRLRLEERRGSDRLKAYADFIDDLDRADPHLVRRLAASQLNQIPADETPVLIATTATRPVTEWIDRSIPPIEPAHSAPPQTRLSRLTRSDERLWLFGVGVMAVFLGLLFDPALTGRRSRTGEAADGRPPTKGLAQIAKVAFIRVFKPTAASVDVIADWEAASMRNDESSVMRERVRADTDLAIGDEIDRAEEEAIDGAGEVDAAWDLLIDEDDDAWEQEEEEDDDDWDDDDEEEDDEEWDEEEWDDEEEDNDEDDDEDADAEDDADEGEDEADTDADAEEEWDDADDDEEEELDDEEDL